MDDTPLLAGGFPRPVSFDVDNAPFLDGSRPVVFKSALAGVVGVRPPIGTTRFQIALRARVRSTQLSKPPQRVKRLVLDEYFLVALSDFGESASLHGGAAW